MSTTYALGEAAGLTYEQVMAVGVQRYRDVLDALAGAGVAAQFTQTGGMCAAIEAVLEGGRVLLVTDAEDTLAWERGAHRGWGVGVYRPDGDGGYLDDGPLVYDSVRDGSIAALLALVARVLLSAPGGR